MKNSPHLGPPPQLLLFPCTWVCCEKKKTKEEKNFILMFILPTTKALMENLPPSYPGRSLEQTPACMEPLIGQ